MLHAFGGEPCRVPLKAQRLGVFLSEGFASTLMRGTVTSNRMGSQSVTFLASIAVLFLWLSMDNVLLINLVNSLI